MKKQILLTVTAMMLTAGIAAGTNGTEAQAAKKIAINKKNFPDQVFRELVKSNYDKNKDKKLSSSEIKRAKKFGRSSCKTTVKIKKSKYGKYEKKYIKDIKKFKGIEKLTNLREFVANETSVKTINLKKNKKLTYLEMTDGNLQKLDLNSNKKLKYVYLEYNKLTSLKMNKCKKLLRVDLTGHMVKKLKINRNKKTKVFGEEYYTPFSATQVKSKFVNINKGGQIDGDGSFCVYEWSTDHSSCVRKVVSGSSMISQPVTLDATAVAKAKTMQKITAQWKDTQGNFYFLADKDGDMVSKTVYYLCKVNPQGNLVAEMNISEQLLTNMGYDSTYTMSLLNQGNGTAILGILGYSKHGVVYVDLEKMVLTKQATCNFVPKTAEGDVIAGVISEEEDFDEVIVSKMVATKTQTLQNNGNEIQIQVCELSSNHRMDIPLRNSYDGYTSAVQICNNYIYVISGEGFFKAKLTAKKFTQLYGISKLKGMQDVDVTFSLSMKNEKEIYLMTKKSEDDKATYTLQACRI